MRAIVIPRHGTADVLRVEEREPPPVGEGEVGIAVHAAGLNFAEVMARKGLYPDAPRPPTVVGYEVSGVVDALGPGARRFAIGDRVLALTRFGGHAERVSVPEAQCFRMPDAMSFEHGAAIPVVYLTAHHMLFQIKRIRAGETVLIHMAAGGVGTAAIQLCRTVPGVTTIGTASAAKHDYVRSQGLHHAIDYHREDYVARVLELTDGRGVDLVLDALGGRDWKKGYGLLKPSGTLVAFGWANMSSGERRNVLHVLGELGGLPLFHPGRLMNDNRTVAGVNMGHLWDHIELLAWQIEAIVEHYRAGAVTPVIDRVFSFAEAAEAHRYLESGKNRGKVLLVP